jgi:dihydrofolate reductase
MLINLVVATSENGVIGKDGGMPWSMQADLKHFKKITTSGESNIVIMGRKTYESIGKPLFGRINCVITRNKNNSEADYTNAQCYSSIEDALEYAKGLEYFLKKEMSVHIIGGANIYEQVMKMGIVDRIHHTLIHANLEGDTFFHVPSDWDVVNYGEHLADEDNTYDCTFRVLTKDQCLSSSQGLNSLFR